MEYVLIGLAVVAVLGYFAVKKAESAVTQLGTSMASSLAAGVGITTITLDASTPQGDQGQYGLGPNDSLVINAYPPPAGYVWKFDGGTGMKLTAGAGASATFALVSPPPTAPFTVYANLVKAGATLPPTATFKFTVHITTSGQPSLTTPPVPPSA